MEQARPVILERTHIKIHEPKFILVTKYIAQAERVATRTNQNVGVSTTHVLLLEVFKVSLVFQQECLYYTDANTSLFRYKQTSAEYKK